MKTGRNILGSCLALLAVAVTGCAPSRLPSAPTSAPTVDPSTMLGVILRAEDLRRPDLVPDDALVHHEPTVRAAAIRALGRIGGDPRSSTSIRRALSDPDPVVRGAAVLAYTRIDPFESGNALAAWARDPAAEVRAAAATAAGLLEPGVAAATVRTLLDDADLDVRARAVAAASGSSPNRPIVERLGEIADAPQLRLAAAVALADIGRPGAADGRGPDGFLARRAARDRLLALAHDPAADVRAQVARGLAIPSSPADTAALLDLAKDPDPLVRVHAHRSFDYPLSPLVSLAESGPADPDPVVRAVIYQGLGAVPNPRAAQLIAVGLRNDREIAWLVALGLPALYRAAPDGALQSAANLVTHPSPAVRVAVCGALAGVARYAAPAIHEVVRSMAIRDVPEVREAAVEALQVFGIPLSDFPAEVLGSDDARVRTGLARAAEAALRSAVGSRSSGPVLDVLEELARTVPDDTSVRAQVALIDAAAAAPDDPRARAILEARSRSGDPALRRRAAAALGEPTPPTGPGGAVPDLSPYADIARWAAVPRAALIRVQRPGFLPGRFTIALDARSAPLATYAFAQAAEAGRFDGIEFRDLIPGVRILAGDPADPAFDRIDRRLRDEPFDGPFPAGAVVLEAPGADLGTGPFQLTVVPLSGLSGRATRIGIVVQNFDGVVRRLLPGDKIVGISIYEGDGTEPLPPIEGS